VGVVVVIVVVVVALHVADIVQPMSYLMMHLSGKI